MGFDPEIIAGIIGAFGSLLAILLDRSLAPRQGRKTVNSMSRLRRLLKVAPFAVLIGGIITLVLWDWTGLRLKQQLDTSPGYLQQIYPQAGMGFCVPIDWKVDDASLAVSGGDIDLIRDLDPVSRSVAQGMELRLSNVAESYVNNPQAEIDYQLEIWRQFDSTVAMERVRLGEHDAVRFTYSQSHGSRSFRYETYWLNLTPRVRLEIDVFSTLDSTQQAPFRREAQSILASFVFDRFHLEDLTANLL